MSSLLKTNKENVVLEITNSVIYFLNLQRNCIMKQKCTQ